MKIIILVVLIAISFSAKSQKAITDKSVPSGKSDTAYGQMKIEYVADTVAFLSLHDLDVFLQNAGDKISHTEWLKMQNYFMVLIQSNDEKRKVKKKH